MLSLTTHKQKSSQNYKKKPPPRPPPPKFSKYKSKSTFTLNQQPNENINLIEWSPPNSPRTETKHNFGGSVSSSFSSSTSSLASSKKSFEYEPSPIMNVWPVQNNVNQSSSTAIWYQSTATNQSSAGTKNSASTTLTVPSLFGPTIIRPQAPKKVISRSGDTTPPSPPMPTIPPPSPPKEQADAAIETPYGIALYDFPATLPSDLQLQVNDVVILIRRINSEWLYGRVLDKEGMFPANFIDIQVPLKGEEFNVTALYEFHPQMPGDLELTPRQTVRVIRKISDEWLYGESQGKTGQFPSNFVDRIPKDI